MIETKVIRQTGDGDVWNKSLFHETFVKVVDNTISSLGLTYESFLETNGIVFSEEYDKIRYGVVNKISKTELPLEGFRGDKRFAFQVVDLFFQDITKAELTWGIVAYAFDSFLRSICNSEFLTKCPDRDNFKILNTRVYCRSLISSEIKYPNRTTHFGICDIDWSKQYSYVLNINDMIDLFQTNLCVWLSRRKIVLKKKDIQFYTRLC